MSDFERKALKGIPAEILSSLSKEVNDGIEGSIPLEAIMKSRQKMVESVKSVTPEVTQQKKTKIVTIDNVAIEVPLDQYQAFYSMVAYYFATVGYKDKKINKILKAFNFSFRDANGELLYPVEKKKK
jgi:hypothetical protein